IPGVLHVSLDGQYASWVGMLMHPDEPLLLVAPEARVEEALMRLARVGYENVIGTLDGGMRRWKVEGHAVASIPAEPVHDAFRPGRRVLDVRRDREWEEGHLEG